jgi:cysteine synthase A
VWIVIDDAERLGLISPRTGSRIFEGTVGSTGISIATIARARSVVSAWNTGLAHYSWAPRLRRGYDTSELLRKVLAESTVWLSTRPSAIIMPDDVAAEKIKSLHALGADVQLVRPASIVDKEQYVVSDFASCERYEVLRNNGTTGSESSATAG